MIDSKEVTSILDKFGVITLNGEFFGFCLGSPIDEKILSLNKPFKHLSARQRCMNETCGMKTAECE